MDKCEKCDLCLWNQGSGGGAGGGGGGSSGFTLLRATYDSDQYKYVLPVTAAELFTLMSSSTVAFRTTIEYEGYSSEKQLQLIRAYNETNGADPTQYGFDAASGLSAYGLDANDIVEFSESY